LVFYPWNPRNLRLDHFGCGLPRCVNSSFSLALGFARTHGFVARRVPKFRSFREKFSAHFLDPRIGHFFELLVKRMMRSLVRIVVLGVIATEQRPTRMRRFVLV